MEILHNTKKEWFGEWFDSHYYHLLYQNRNDKEAEIFIDNLLKFLDPAPKSYVLDLACGRGRHSVFLSKKNLEVVGIDLSKQNIAFAKRFETDKLKFFVQDMRNVVKENTFDYVLNMFTSFGYLENDKDNLKVLKAASKNLKTKGKLVIDFLNPEKAIETLIPYESKNIKGVEFEIKRYLKNGFIIKEINFSDNEKSHQFFEKVRAFSKEDFLSMFEKANLKVLEVFGDYQLHSFNKNTSDRMIFIVEKELED